MPILRPRRFEIGFPVGLRLERFIHGFHPFEMLHRLLIGPALPAADGVLDQRLIVRQCFIQGIGILALAYSTRTNGSPRSAPIETPSLDGRPGTRRDHWPSATLPSSNSEFSRRSAAALRHGRRSSAMELTPSLMKRTLLSVQPVTFQVPVLGKALNGQATGGSEQSRRKGDDLCLWRVRTG